MGRENVTFDPKSQLVVSVCNLAIACSHKSPFIDWYRVLQIEENAGLEIIRKQFCKLGMSVELTELYEIMPLQLHPDKNKHPKAETAFKFLSEAYSCLSNNERRAKFNLERKNSKCLECNKIKVSKINGPMPTEILVNSRKTMQNFGDLRARLSEEAKVIQNCLKAISALKRENLLDNDYPVFNPANYLYQRYPQRRTTTYKNSEIFHSLWKNNPPIYNRHL